MYPKEYASILYYFLLALQLRSELLAIKHKFSMIEKVIIFLEKLTIEKMFFRANVSTLDNRVLINLKY